MLCGSTVVDHGDCCSNQQRRLSDDFRFVVGRRLLLLSFSIFQFVVSLYYLLYKYNREGEKVMKRRKEEGEKVKREKKKRRTRRRNRKKLEREEVVQEEEEDQVNQNEHKTT